MRAQLAILVLVGAVSTTSAGQLMDENTRELTNRGAIVSMFASAQVSEMRCSLITKALNDKNRLFGRAVLRDGDCGDRKKRPDWNNWCQSYRDKAAPLFEKQ
jgi:hypothetical protein